MKRSVCIFMAIFWVTTAAAAQEHPFQYKADGRRDPFWPLVNASGSVINYDKNLAISDMVLEGIVVGNDGKNVAIVNGMLVKSGDKIGTFIVKQVMADRVILLKNKNEYILKLKKED